jgi:hypothetical protein
MKWKKTLNEPGADGWEPVQAEQASDSLVYFYFKRAK